jgi:hypothetical protein
MNALDFFVNLELSENCLFAATSLQCHPLTGNGWVKKNSHKLTVCLEVTSKIF